MLLYAILLARIHCGSHRRPTIAWSPAFEFIFLIAISFHMRDDQYSLSVSWPPPPLMLLLFQLPFACYVHGNILHSKLLYLCPFARTPPYRDCNKPPCTPHWLFERFIERERGHVHYCIMGRRLFHLTARVLDSSHWISYGEWLCFATSYTESTHNFNFFPQLTNFINLWLVLHSSVTCINAYCYVIYYLITMELTFDLWAKWLHWRDFSSKLNIISSW